MAGGAFDPAEFASFKAGAGRAAEQPHEATGGGFDPAEFGAFKSSRAAGGASRDSAPNPFRRDQSTPSFDERFGDGPMASTADTRSGLGQGMRRAADERLVGPTSALNAVSVAAMRAGNAVGLNLPRNAGAAIASLPGIGNGRSFSENYALAGEQEDALARQYPKTALAGTVAGIGAGAVALPSVRVAEGAGLAMRTGANALTGAIYGGTAEGFDKKTVEATAAGAALGGALGGAGSYALEKAAPVVMGLFRKGVPIRDEIGNLSPEAMAAIREAGVDPALMPPEFGAQLEAAFKIKGPSAAVAREVMAADQGITLSRGQATRDPAAVDLANGSLSGARGARAQTVGQEFAQQQARVREAAAAQRARDEALQAVRGPAPVDALDGATAAVQGVRDAAGQARSAYRGAYDEIAQIPGTFAPRALDDIGARISRSLGPDVPIDPVLTPATSRFMADLDNLPAILGLRDGETPTLQQVEQIRKRLSAYYGGTAQNPTDRRALGAVRDAFDQRIDDLLSIGQFGQRSATPPGGRGAPVDDFPGFGAGGRSIRSAPLLRAP